MPILPREIDQNPPGLLDRPELGAQPDQAWWALYTLARREKHLLRQLRTAGLAFYAPLIPRRTRSPSGRIRTSYVPLFHNYVFLYGTVDDRYRAMTTNCVSHWLPVADPLALSADLRQIQRLIDSSAPLTPEARIEAGQRVRIRSGTFAGLEGTVLKRHGQSRLVISVRFLQQGASVLLEDCQLEALQ